MEEKHSSRVAINKRGYLDWQLEQYEKEMIMSGYVLSSKPIPDLLQNCDLPTPLKFFSPIGDDEKLKARSSSLSPTAPLLYQISSPDPTPPSTKELESEQDESSDQITSLLRALQLSQTRAREAEKEFMATAERNKQMMTLLLEDSLRLSAHRQWVRILETENIVLRNRKVEDTTEGKGDDMSGVADMASWCFLALCLGIAGVGLALGTWLF